MESSIRERLNSPFRNLQEIPEDIIIEILLRLPVKSLLRFRSICKAWYYLIKNHNFICMHHKFNLGTASQLLVCSGNKFSFHSNDKSASMLSPCLKLPSNRHLLYVTGSCNGIVCYLDDQSTIFLCNPATREFLELPPSSFHSDMTDLNFEQIGFAFGFDSTNIYDFKVLRMFRVVGKEGHGDFTRKEIRGEMFTWSSNTWRQLDWGLNNELRFLRRGIFCANSFHFTVVVPGVNPYEGAIVCCDISTERFKMMDLPPKTKDESRHFAFLMLFKESLSAVYSYPWFNCQEKRTEIWVMQDYGVVESWTKLYSIEPPSTTPVCFWMDNHALLLVQQNAEQLVSCHLKTLQLEKIEICGYKLYSRIVVFTETLVSIMQ